jgi:hypothetical protein
MDHKTKQVKQNEFGQPKKKQKGESLLYKGFGVPQTASRRSLCSFFPRRRRADREAAEYGVVSYISNSSYLTGRSHPLMRRSLLTNFNEVWLDNLNGDKYHTFTLWTVVNERDGRPGRRDPARLPHLRTMAGRIAIWDRRIDDRVPQNPAPVARAIIPDYALGGHTASLGLCWIPAGTLPGFP